MAASHNMVINDGRRLLLQVGDDLINILPENIVAKRCVDKVERNMNMATFTEKVIVRFKNGHWTYLTMQMDRPDVIGDEELKRFQATCIMIYDL